MAHSETSDPGARRAAFVLASSCCALFVACNVYDASLIGTSSLAGAGAAGGLVVGGSGPMHVGGASGSDGGDGSVGEAGNAGSAGGPEYPGGANGRGGTSGAAGSAPAAGTAGLVGSGGAPSGGATNSGLSMIDDMETPDAYIPLLDSRQGYWSLSNDGTAAGKQTPSPVVMSAIPGGRAGSLDGLHTTATGFTKSGALVGVDLNRKGSTRATYDASAYVAVHFWAKVEAASPVDIHFAILDRHTDPGGALCCPAMGACGSGNIANGLCYDHFTKDLTLSHEWAEYTVPFTGLNQVGWGDNHVDALDAAHVFGIQLSWGSAAMDLWLDDIAFVKK